ncbi:MAG: MFS transporter [Spirochaetaceae bacterium]
MGHKKPTVSTFRLRPPEGTTIGYFWALFTLGLAAASIGPSLGGLARNTGASLGAVSIVFAAYRAGFVGGAFLGGALLDRLRGNPVVATMMLVMAVVFAAIPQVSTLAVVGAGFLVLGVGAGTVEIGSNTLLVWRYGNDVGPYMNGLHFAFGIGAILSPVLIGRAIEITGGLTGGFLLASLLILPGTLLLVRGASPSSPAEEESTGTPSSVVPVVLVAVFLLLYVGAEAGFGGWVYTYAVTLNLASPAQAGGMTSAFWGALTAGRLLLVPVSSRVAPRHILVAGAAGSVVFLGFAALPVVSPNAVLLWAVSAGLGLSMAGIFPGTMSFAGRHLRVTGSVSRWFFVGAGAGGMSIPWLVGRVVDAADTSAAGAPAIMWILLVISTAMAAVLVALLVVLGRP